MVNNTKIQEWMTSLTEFLNEQQWYQELKAKWDELDPQSRTYLKFAGFGCALLAVILIILSSIWSVHSLKAELREKKALLNLIQSANDELRRLRETTPSSVGKDREGGPWPAYFESLASSSGFDKAALTVSPEKVGTPGDLTRESLFDLNLKHINIKQIVRFAFALESGQRPVKLRNLMIETKSDPSGYLDASLAISAFTLVEPK